MSWAVSTKGKHTLSLPGSATSSGGCEAFLMVAQVSAEDRNRKGCPSRSEAQSDGAAKSVRACGGPRKGNRRPHWAGGISSAADRARLRTPKYSASRAALDHYTLLRSY